MRTKEGEAHKMDKPVIPATIILKIIIGIGAFVMAFSIWKANELTLALGMLVVVIAVTLKALEPKTAKEDTEELE
jgi:hypothetical protein